MLSFLPVLSPLLQNTQKTENNSWGQLISSVHLETTVKKVETFTFKIANIIMEVNLNINCYRWSSNCVVTLHLGVFVEGKERKEKIKPTLTAL